MNFLIEIRHMESGLAKAFGSLDEIAHFLADKVEAEWEGWRHLGELPAVPAPEVAAEPAADSDAPAETVEVVITPEGAVHSDQLEGAKPMADLPAGSDAPQDPGA